MEHRTRTDVRTLTGRLALALLALAGGSAARAQQLYDPPVWADDMPADQRLYTTRAKHSDPGHPQEWGYDIHAVRYLGGTSWSTRTAGATGTSNSTYVIYNKPVYAMAPGTVIACWRNAPENPSAGVLRPEVTSRHIGLGGNFLWIEEDDGDRVLYGHATSGSIPESLCRHNAAFFPTPYAVNDDQMPAQSHLSIFNRPRVAAGDFLMRAGNSGNSTEPHLHIHKIDSAGVATPLNFERGLYSPWTSTGASYDQWTRYAGGPIPPGPVVIWPPRRSVREVSSIAHPASDYGRVFLHLWDSGFRPFTVDTYSVGGSSFINFAWRPTTLIWRASSLVGAADYQAHIDADERDGYAPVQIESSMSGLQVRYSVTSIKNLPATWIARHGLTYDEHLALMGQARQAGLSPASVSVVSVAGARRYTVLYRPMNIGGWDVHSRVREADYQALVEAQEAAGLYPVYVNAYMHQGTAYLSAIFAQSAGTVNRSAHSLSVAEYPAEYDEWVVGNGLFTRSVTSFDGAQQQHRFAAVFTNP